LIKANHDKVEQIAHALLKYETLQVDEVQQILDGKGLEKPTVGELLAVEQAKRTPKDESTDKAGKKGDEGPALGAVPQLG